MSMTCSRVFVKARSSSLTKTAPDVWTGSTARLSKDSGGLASTGLSHFHTWWADLSAGCSRARSLLRRNLILRVSGSSRAWKIRLRKHERRQMGYPSSCRCVQLSCIRACECAHTNLSGNMATGGMFQAFIGKWKPGFLIIEGASHSEGGCMCALIIKGIKPVFRILWRYHAP